MLSDTQLWGFYTANLALAVACVAAVGTGISLIISVASYLRGGPRIQLNIEAALAVPIKGRGSVTPTPVLRVTATNEGMTRVRVSHLYLWFRQAEGLVIPRFDHSEIKRGRGFQVPFEFFNGKMPAQIEGFDYYQWSIERSGLFVEPVSDPQHADFSRKVKVRATIKAVGVGRVHSKWIEISIYPSIPRDLVREEQIIDGQYLLRGDDGRSEASESAGEG